MDEQDLRTASPQANFNHSNGSWSLVNQNKEGICSFYTTT